MKASVLFVAGWESDSPVVLWRDDADASRYALIPVSASAGRPTLESVNRLTHEHELNSHLDSCWALRPPELLPERGRVLRMPQTIRKSRA